MQGPNLRQPGSGVVDRACPAEGGRIIDEDHLEVAAVDEKCPQTQRERLAGERSHDDRCSALGGPSRSIVHRNDYGQAGQSGPIDPWIHSRSGRDPGQHQGLGRTHLSRRTLAQVPPRVPRRRQALSGDVPITERRRGQPARLRPVLCRSWVFALSGPTHDTRPPPRSRVRVPTSNSTPLTHLTRGQATPRRSAAALRQGADGLGANPRPSRQLRGLDEHPAMNRRLRMAGLRRVTVSLNRAHLHDAHDQSISVWSQMGPTGRVASILYLILAAARRLIQRAVCAGRSSEGGTR